MSPPVWEYEESSDHLLGEDSSAFPDRVLDLFQVSEGVIFLQSDQHHVEICWRDRVAVIGYRDSDMSGLECAITEASLDQSESISSTELLDWTCSCCGVSLGRFTRSMHIRREIAFEIFRHIVVNKRRPDTSNGEDVVWMNADVD